MAPGERVFKSAAVNGLYLTLGNSEFFLFAFSVNGN